MQRDDVTLSSLRHLDDMWLGSKFISLRVDPLLDGRQIENKKSCFS